jgi:hypothetical protein
LERGQQHQDSVRRAFEWIQSRFWKVPLLITPFMVLALTISSTELRRRIGDIYGSGNQDSVR